MTDKPTFNDLCPYPDRVSEVTAEKLARYNAMVGLHEHYLRMKLDGLVDGHAWKAALHKARTGWAVSFLLRQLIKHAGPEVADLAAQRLWLDWDDTQDVEQELATWVSAADIDPKVLDEMAKGSYENYQALKAHVAGLSSPWVHANQPELPLEGGV
ncbi:hypothetical protein [Streptomyces sp.]|jgi:hypothetical protein|uniref:hypothetical protein n=1 Tax=Streptomyces sp. TaxID=1931 RepID=UPI002F94CC10